MEEVKNLIFDDLGKEYVFRGGSGGSGTQPAPNSVGTEEIKDGGVHAEDLDPNMFITPEEARNKVADAIEKAEREHGIQESGS